MKKILVLLAIFLLVGCSINQEEDCLDSLCIDAKEYGIEGTLKVNDIERGDVHFQVTLKDDNYQLRNMTIEIYSSEWDFIGEVESSEHLHLLSSSQPNFQSLKPSTDYIAVMTGMIVEDGEFKNITIDYTAFKTDAFSINFTSGSIDNIRTGSSYVLFDYDLLSNDYYIVSYAVILYEGETKLNEFTVWGSRDLTSLTKHNQVFSDLESNTTYTLTLSVISELETQQIGEVLDEITFTTD